MNFLASRLRQSDERVLHCMWEPSFLPLLYIGSSWGWRRWWRHFSDVYMKWLVALATSKQKMNAGTKLTIIFIFSFVFFVLFCFCIFVLYFVFCFLIQPNPSWIERCYSHTQGGSPVKPLSEQPQGYTQRCVQGHNLSVAVKIKRGHDHFQGITAPCWSPVLLDLGGHCLVVVLAL